MSSLSRRLLTNLIRLRTVGSLNRMSSSVLLTKPQLVCNSSHVNVTPLRQFSSAKNDDDGRPDDNNEADREVMYIDNLPDDPISQVLIDTILPYTLSYFRCPLR